MERRYSLPYRWIILSVWFFYSGTQIWASTCSELFKSSDPNKRITQQKDLKFRAQNAGYDIFEIQVNVEGVVRNIAVVGEEHDTPIKFAQAGEAFLKTFEAVGYENAEHLIRQIPQLSQVLKLAYDQSAGVALGNSMVKSSVRTFDLEVGLDVGIVNRFRYGRWGIINLAPKSFNTLGEFDLKKIIEDTLDLRDQKMAENIFSFLITNKEITKIAVVVGKKHLVPLSGYLVRISAQGEQTPVQ